MRLELKTYQDVKQLWTKWAKFKRYVKVWKEEGGFFFTLLSCFPCLLSFPANHKKNEKTKINYLVPKSSKKYAGLKKMALKTDSRWWSYAWSKKMLNMSPIVTWQILTWPTKKRISLFPISTFDNHFTIKLLLSESFF